MKAEDQYRHGIEVEMNPSQTLHQLANKNRDEVARDVLRYQFREGVEKGEREKGVGRK